MTRILITGFEPFGGESVNPSHDVGLRLAGEAIDGLELHYRLLPVKRYEAVELAMAEVRRLRPNAVVSLGQAGGRARITPERIAVNVDDFRMPDHAGATPRDEPHDAAGPDAYLCTLPVRAMVEAMLAAGVPAAISNSAGTFLCNHVAYGVLHALAQEGRPCLAGFVHLPYLPEQTATKPAEVASMSLETMLTGLRAGLAAVADACAGTRPLEGAATR